LFFFCFLDMAKTVCIFHAPQKPNAKGEYNWYEFKEVPKLDLKTLQTLVNCSHVTLLPNIDPSDKAKLVCYADDEGLLKPDCGRNELAGGALFKLGFRGSEIMGHAYAGNIVVVGAGSGGDDKGLSANQQKMLTDAITAYRKDWKEDDDDDDDDDSSEAQTEEVAAVETVTPKRKRIT